jgi:hypothetical protein
MPGDEVKAWGHWRRGGLELRRTLNLRTGARTCFRAAAPCAPLVIHLAILAIVLLVLLRSVPGLLGGGR